MLIKTRTVRIMKAIYHDIILNLYELKGINDNKVYVIFSLQSKKPNDYIDFSFSIEDMPLFVKYIYQKIASKYSINRDDNGYILNGPCLKSGEVLKMSFIFENDYNDMMRRNSVLIYHYGFSIDLSNKYLKPIYNSIIDL